MSAVLGHIETPLVHSGAWAADIDLWVKDESLCPTHTFKDRLAWKYVELANAGVLPRGPETILASITLGNTMNSLAKAVVDGMIPENRPKLFAIFPSHFSARSIGPDSKGRFCRGTEIIRGLTEIGVCCIEYPLEQGFLGDSELKQLAGEYFVSSGPVCNISNGLGIPAYKQILIDSLAEMPTVPDYIIVPVGAGVLFTEFAEVIAERGLPTQLIGVAVTRPDSLADKLYSLYSPFFSDLLHTGIALFHNDARFIVTQVVDKQINSVKSYGLPPGFDEAEPSSWASLIPLLEPISNQPRLSGVVLAINTGNGLLGTATVAR